MLRFLLLRKPIEKNLIRNIVQTPSEVLLSYLSLLWTDKAPCSDKVWFKYCYFFLEEFCLQLEVFYISISHIDIDILTGFENVDIDMVTVENIDINIHRYIDMDILENLDDMVTLENIDMDILGKKSIFFSRNYFYAFLMEISIVDISPFFEYR